MRDPRGRPPVPGLTPPATGREFCKGGGGGAGGAGGNGSGTRGGASGNPVQWTAGDDNIYGTGGAGDGVTKGAGWQSPPYANTGNGAAGGSGDHGGSGAVKALFTFPATNTAVYSLTDIDNNAITVAATQRLWLDSLFVSIAPVASSFIGGAVGPNTVSITGSPSGTVYFVVPGPDSTDGDECPAVNRQLELPAGGFGLIPGDTLGLGTFVNKTGATLDGAVSITASCRIRLASEG